MDFILDSIEKEKWLAQHIPHRVCAADPFHIYCVGRGMDEGRKSAVRWLIDLLGVAGTEAGDPYRPTKKKTDVTLERFGAWSFDLNSPNAVTLAKIWKGCSQATSHATTDTNHFAVGDKELAEALTAVVEYLEAQLYAPAGKCLLKIVRAKS
jgi:hypothetical protein